MNKNVLKETCTLHRVGNLQMNIYETGYDIPYHWHDEYEFIFVRRGLCNCVVNGESKALNENQLLLIQGGNMHTVNTDASSDFFAVVVHPHILGTDCSHFFSPNICFKDVFTTSTSLDRKIIKYILEAKKIFDTKNFGYEILLKACIGNVFGTLFKNQLYTYSLGNKTKNSETFEKLIKHINSHYNEVITLEELSQISYSSKAHVINLFKLNTGKTPIEYINRYRIFQAQEMLKYTDKSIIDVAFACGFDNIGHFINIFKRYLGTTPNKWRKGESVN